MSVGTIRTIGTLWKTTIYHVPAKCHVQWPMSRCSSKLYTIIHPTCSLGKQIEKVWCAPALYYSHPYTDGVFVLKSAIVCENRSQWTVELLFHYKCKCKSPDTLHSRSVFMLYSSVWKQSLLVGFLTSWEPISYSHIYLCCYQHKYSLFKLPMNRAVQLLQQVWLYRQLPPIWL